MSSLLIDRDKCKKDGLCVAECPMLIIEMKAGDFPSFVDYPGAHCLECGHCVAVCPHEALSLDMMPASDCLPLDHGQKLDRDQVRQLMLSRRSCRQYKPEPLPKSEIEELMDMAFYAPTGSNRQPMDWTIVYDTQEVKKLTSLVLDWMRLTIKDNPRLAETLNMPAVVAASEKGHDRILRGCPHLIVGHAPKDERTAPAACVGAISYIELAAPCMGIGTCWAGYFTRAALSYEPLQRALDLPEGHQVFGAVMLGYPKAKYYRIPQRKRPGLVWK